MVKVSDDVEQWIPTNLTNGNSKHEINRGIDLFKNIYNHKESLISDQFTDLPYNMTNDYVKNFKEDMYYFVDGENEIVNEEEWDIETLLKSLVPNLKGLIRQIQHNINKYNVRMTISQYDIIKKLGSLSCTQIDCVVKTLDEAEKENGEVCITLPASHPSWVYYPTGKDSDNHSDSERRNEFTKYCQKLIQYLTNTNTDQCVLCDYFSHVTNSYKTNKNVNLLNVRDFCVPRHLFEYNSNHILENQHYFTTTQSQTADLICILKKIIIKNDCVMLDTKCEN